MSNQDCDVAVIGAGIAGLTTAYRLAAAGRSVRVLEGTSRSGGRIHTETVPYGYLENGGIFHTQQYVTFRKLLAELDLTDRVTTVPTGFNSRVLTGRGWKRVDYGSLLGPALFGGIPVTDRLRLGLAALPALRRRPKRDGDYGDLVSMLDLDTRSSAAAVPDSAADYFTAGPHEFLWGTRSDAISYGMLALQLHVFAGELREIGGGVGQVTDRLTERLDVRYDTEVAVVSETSDGVLINCADDTQVQARTAVIATPADVARTIWADPPAAVTQHLVGIEYTRIDYLYLHTSRPVEITQDGKQLSMEVIPTASNDGRTIGGIYQANGWANEGGLLLVTAANAARAGDIPDDELADRLQRDAEDLHPELRGQVLDRVLVRHPRYTPTFGAGAIGRLAAARQSLGHGRIDLAGDHMSAPWVEGAVCSGEMAAARVAAALGT